MGIAIPYLQKLQKEGESGRKKMNQITRWLTILITLVQGPGYIYNLYRTLPNSAFLLGFDSFSFLFSSSFAEKMTKMRSLELQCLLRIVNLLEKKYAYRLFPLVVYSYSIWG
jgi:hypothetical protein